MEATKRRIFVGNLPCEMSESDLKDRFDRFGKVMKVEIKNSNNVGAQSCYAFLDLEIEANVLDTCFRSLSKQNWNGHSIKLELAKESFLSRLQRERQEAKPVQAALPEDEGDTKNNYLKKAKAANNKQSNTTNKKRKHSSEDDKCDRFNEEINPDSHHLPSDIFLSSGNSVKGDNPAFTEKSLKKGLLQKFESFSDVWKDPPTYTSHKIPKAHKQREQQPDADDDFQIVPQNEEEMPTLKLDGLPSSLKKKSTCNRTFESEEKRLKSIETRKKSFMQQKQAVALALASVDSNIKPNNKIIFDDRFDEEIAPSRDHKQLDESNGNPRKAQKGPNLFEEEMPGEEEQEYDFNIKRQFEGRKGQKLLDLQSKYADDKRFTLDDRFYESDNDDEDEKGTNTEKEDSINDERTRQIEILQSIVGSNLPFTPEDRKGKQVNVDSMVVHYDPTRDDHAKYEIKRDIPKKIVLAPSKSQEKKLEEKREKKKQRRELPPAVQLPVVSKETFYKVSASLKESLKTGDAKGFSLLETFGSIDTEESTTNEDTYSCKPIPTTNKKTSTHKSANPFKWDSSDSEDEPDDTLAARHVTSPSLQQQQQPVQAQGIWRESFFFKANDDRLNEGLNFFGQEEPSTENFSTRRREVKQIVRAKVKHNVRISAPKRKNLGGKKQNKFRGARGSK